MLVFQRYTERPYLAISACRGLFEFLPSTVRLSASLVVPPTYILLLTETIDNIGNQVNVDIFKSIPLIGLLVLFLSLLN